MRSRPSLLYTKVGYYSMQEGQGFHHPFPRPLKKGDGYEKRGSSSRIYSGASNDTLDA